MLLEGTVSPLFKKCKTFSLYTLQDTYAMSHSVELERFPTETQDQKIGHGLLCKPDGRSSCFGECIMLGIVHLCMSRGEESRRFFCLNDLQTSIQVET